MKELEHNNILNKQNLEEIFALYNIQPSFIEKDFYITKILNVLSKINNEVFNLVFTGGTSLHKCYNLKKFGQDMNYTIQDMLNNLINRLKNDKLYKEEYINFVYSMCYEDNNGINDF